jgi:hypothetical protein
MKNKNILLKARDFKYPNERERKQAMKNFPKLEKFYFEYKNDFELFFSENLRAKEVHRIYNLYWWDECLGNRIGFLGETYTYVFTQELRGLKYGAANNENILQVNKILFEYYLELFYHFFISTRDIVLQILNLYFRVGYEEEKVSFNPETPKLFDKLPTSVLTTVKSFYNNVDIRKAVKLRNSFTHRYTPTGPDYRLEFKIVDGKETLAGGGIKRESNESFINNINKVLTHLSIYLNDLKKQGIQ